MLEEMIKEVFNKLLKELEKDNIKVHIDSTIVLENTSKTINNLEVFTIENGSDFMLKYSKDKIKKVLE